MILIIRNCEDIKNSEALMTCKAAVDSRYEFQDMYRWLESKSRVDRVVCESRGVVEDFGPMIGHGIVTQR